MDSYWYWNVLYLLCAVFVACLVPTRTAEYAGSLNCSLNNVNTTLLIAKLPRLPDFPCLSLNCTANLSCCEEGTTTEASTTTSTEETTESATTPPGGPTTPPGGPTTPPGGPTPSSTDSNHVTDTPGQTSVSLLPDTSIPMNSTSKQTATPMRNGTQNTTLAPPVSPSSSPPMSNDTWAPVLIAIIVSVFGLFVIVLAIYYLKPHCKLSNKVEAADEQAVELAPAGNGKIKVEKHLRPGSLELIPVVAAQNTSSCNPSAPCVEVDKKPLSSPESGPQVIMTPHKPDQHTINIETGRDRTFSTGSQAGDTTVLMQKVVPEGRTTKKRKKRGSKGVTELKPLRKRQLSYDVNFDDKETKS